jgi:hypothetical protein
VVGLGGTDGSIGVVAISVGARRLPFGVQPARAAPAATVALSLRNVRREMGCRRFMGHLLIRYRSRTTNNNHVLSVL